MAKFKALKSFAGIVTMKKGDVKEINDENVSKDLLNAGYVIGLDSEEKPKASTSKKATKKADKAGELDG